MRTWRVGYCRANPGWEYREWNEAAISSLLDRALNVCPRMQRDVAFRAVHSTRSGPWRRALAQLRACYYGEPTPHGRADIARLLILYLYGGVYIDADSVWLKGSLDRFLAGAEREGVFAAREPGKDWLANGVVGSSLRSPVIGSLIRHLASIDYGAARRSAGPYAVTGPLLLTREAQRIRIVPTKCFYPVPWVGIQDNEAHKKLLLPDGAVMFQYGMTTNRIGAPEN